MALGSVPYWEDIKRDAFPNRPSAVWELGEIDEQVMKDTASIEQLLALTPPGNGAPGREWQNFLAQLNQVDTGERYSNGGATTPLLPWYAYIAKHNPQALYKNLNSGDFDSSKFNHLLQMGMLGDWYQYVESIDKLLLGSEQALLSYALARGGEEARRKVTEAFFNIARDSDRTHPLSLELENIRFAAPAMNPQERQILLDSLLQGPFKIDPRSVRRLTLLEDMNREKLRALIEKFQYSHKSMSSYMTTAALLGEAKYISVMAGDARDNDGQPTNFYCSVCGLALAADGLIGEPLVQAEDRDELQILPSEQYGFVLTREPGAQVAQEGAQ
ncbi:hypothetical protein [Microbulbifer sp.]|uniref:hypothetical protein n=1 Tax=Microbulbifer sp. TaxID=1908541 RepID=UPI003F40728D